MNRIHRVAGSGTRASRRPRRSCSAAQLPRTVQRAVDFHRFLLEQQRIVAGVRQDETMPGGDQRRAVHKVPGAGQADHAVGMPERRFVGHPAVQDSGDRPGGHGRRQAVTAARQPPIN